MRDVWGGFLSSDGSGIKEVSVFETIQTIQQLLIACNGRLRGGVVIGREGGSALATLLQSPRSILSRLTFNPNAAIDDEGARQFANGLEVNVTLTEFAMCEYLLLFH